MSTQEGRIIESGRKGRSKHSNPFTAMILAFCMLFSNPPEAKAIGLNDMMDFMDMYKSMSQLGDLNNLLDYLEQFEEVMAAVEQIEAVYSEAMVVMDQIEDLKATFESLEALGEYYVAYYEAQAVMALTEMLLSLADGLDILSIIDQINSAIDDIYDIAELYTEDLAMLEEIYDTIEDIKSRIDGFIDTVNQIKDTYNQISAIYNAIANYENFMSSFSTLKNSSYMKNAIKDIKNGDPITLEVPEFDFDIDGFTAAFETLMGQMDELQGDF